MMLTVLTVRNDGDTQIMPGDLAMWRKHVRRNLLRVEQAHITSHSEMHRLAGLAVESIPPGYYGHIMVSGSFTAWNA